MSTQDLLIFGLLFTLLGNWLAVSGVIGFLSLRRRRLGRRGTGPGLVAAALSAVAPGLLLGLLVWVLVAERTGSRGYQDWETFFLVVPALGWLLGQAALAWAWLREPGRRVRDRGGRSDRGDRDAFGGSGDG